MSADNLVKLECRPETIGALASNLDRYGAVEGEPQWLVSAVWLGAGGSDYLATSSTRVLADGFIARPLAIDRTDEFVQRLGRELPDISTRLIARQSNLQLPEAASPAPPQAQQYCPAGSYSTDILIRRAERPSATHRVACALLIRFEAGGVLLVGTDRDTLAMVLSDDPGLIDRYGAECESLPAADYLRRYRG